MQSSWSHFLYLEFCSGFYETTTPNPFDEPTICMIFEGVGYGIHFPFKVGFFNFLHLSLHRHKELVDVGFTPALLIYVVHGYQANEAIKGDIQTPVLWRQDLTQLTYDTTTLYLTYDDDVAEYVISDQRPSKKVAAYGIESSS